MGKRYFKDVMEIIENLEERGIEVYTWDLDTEYMCGASAINVYTDKGQFTYTPNWEFPTGNSDECGEFLGWS